MNEREALKLALERIEGNYTVSDKEAITAIKEALAQPEQEPVAWLYESPMPDGSIFVGASAERLTIGVGVTPDTKEIPLYTTPPQRTWVGLTDEEIEQLWRDTCTIDNGKGANLRNQPFYHLSRAIEAKLKEKNT